MDTYSSIGWNREILEDVIDALHNLERVGYEIDNCYRGAYTNVNTYRELAEHIKMLAQILINAVDYVEDYDEEDEDRFEEEDADAIIGDGK